ncbi:MAG: hypothetical protein H7243_05025 [Sphingomonadaceae bacterium]|nr:hypothetical protein [Sphingomonadaceae bacterium]
MIYWHEFTWEAFATIVSALVALVAVLAASVVGWRQTTILARQAEIQNASAKDARFATQANRLLAEQSFRLNLLSERRLVLERFRAIWTEWIREGNLSRESIEALRVLLHSAVLLYESDIADDLSLALDGLSKHARFHARFRDESYDDATRKSWLEKSFEAEDIAIKSLDPLMKKMTERTKVVGHFPPNLLFPN